MRIEPCRVPRALVPARAVAQALGATSPSPACGASDHFSDLCLYRQGASERCPTPAQGLLCAQPVALLLRASDQPDMRHAAIGSAPAPLHAGRRLGSSAPAAAVARPHRTRAGARCRWRLAPSALGGAEPSLVTLPVFPLPNVLHPTQQGVISGAPWNGAQRSSPRCPPPPAPRAPATRSPSPPARLPCPVFEPRYLALFRAVLEEHPGGRGGRFLHVLSPAAAPPALLDNAVGGLPRIGCCAEVEAIEVGKQPVH